MSVHGRLPLWRSLDQDTTSDRERVKLDFKSAEVRRFLGRIYKLVEGMVMSAWRGLPHR